MLYSRYLIKVFLLAGPFRTERYFT